MDNFDERIKTIKKFVEQNKYRLTLHAEKERDADKITKNEIEEALLCDELQIIEDYPNDPRGASFLVLGYTSENLPIHFVMSLAIADVLVIITLYRPDIEIWIDFKIRKER